MLFNSVVAVALMAVGVVAQANVTYIDPATIDPQISASWCIGQRSACETLCSNDAPTNDCNPKALTYNCTCGNGSTPPLAKYKNTLPDYICQANYAGCIKAHPDDAVGQSACKTDIQANCGTLDLANFTSTPTSTSISSSSSSAAVAAATTTTGAASQTTAANVQVTTTSAAPAATSKSAGVAMAVGQQVGAGVLVAGLLAAFGML